MKNFHQYINRKIFFYLIFCLLLNMVIAQSNDCDLSDETIALFQKGEEYSKEERVSYKLYAIDLLNKALKKNPYCDDILLTMAETYFEIGSNTNDIKWELNSKKRSKYIQENQSYLISAQSYLDKIFEHSSNEENLQNARDLNKQIIQTIEQLRNFEKEMKELDKRKKIVHKERLSASPFIQVEVGRGLSYGTVGTKISAYVAPNGFFFTAGLGIGSTPYSLGAGYSFGSYGFNFQIHGAWGSYKFDEKPESALNASVRCNINIVEHFGICADYGLWSSKAGAYKEDWSVGIFYRYSFTAE